jgi:hypothetical protein
MIVVVMGVRASSANVFFVCGGRRAPRQWSCHVCCACAAVRERCTGHQCSSYVPCCAVCDASAPVRQRCTGHQSSSCVKL